MLSLETVSRFSDAIPSVCTCLVNKNKHLLDTAVFQLNNELVVPHFFEEQHAVSLYV